MQAESADSRGMPEHTPEKLGVTEGLKRGPLSTGALEKFAKNVAENIIQSSMSQMEMVEPGVSSSNRDPETIAEELASAVMQVALREVCRGENVEDFRSPRPVKVTMDNGQDETQSFMDESGTKKHFVNMNTETDPGKELQTSKDTQSYHPPLSQSGLPIAGSLDYPDAPPTTPLLPELERSRHSFARKLKGGLAKAFLPSPPPPTPKDRENASDTVVNTPQVELMEQLMHSLSTHDVAGDEFEADPQHKAKMEAFAEALSCNIIELVLSSKSKEQRTENSNLHLLAHTLAQTIITSSLDEVKTHF
ncbi:uncharacterized protein LOC113138323 [Mastacembelus armatus]|uniref:uncharacterized protein LOC113138323 n=1 Tax=Mastacembelus armatus TaxID=205130 RepID=UPI000E4655F2|nr:uncharacterized protein LOC113138323 [Mastacembelus armatus]